MKNKGFYIVVLVLFIVFLGLYISSNSGMIDYSSRHRKVLTDKNIKEFEEDIKNNKEIDVKKYVYDDMDKYDNSISKSTLKVSNFLGNSIKSILDFTFGKLEKLVNEKE